MCSNFLKYTSWLHGWKLQSKHFCSKASLLGFKASQERKESRSEDRRNPLLPENLSLIIWSSSGVIALFLQALNWDGSRSFVLLRVVTHKLFPVEGLCFSPPYSFKIPSWPITEIKQLMELKKKIFFFLIKILASSAEALALPLGKKTK